MVGTGVGLGVVLTFVTTDVVVVVSSTKIKRNISMIKDCAQGNPMRP